MTFLCSEDWDVFAVANRTSVRRGGYEHVK
jgi:hypothetical protein